jgi:Domain of unknown function (DUF1918)
MSAQPTTSTVRRARLGDWIEARGLPGHPSRRGEIVELLGGPGHEHFRVRWDEQHESIVYPADGVIVVPRRRRRGA